MVARHECRPTDRPHQTAQAKRDGAGAALQHQQQDEGDEDISVGVGKATSAADEEASANTYSAFKRVASTGGDPAQ